MNKRQMLRKRENASLGVKLMRSKLNNKKAVAAVEKAYTALKSEHATFLTSLEEQLDDLKRQRDLLFAKSPKPLSEQLAEKEKEIDMHIAEFEKMIDKAVENHDALNAAKTPVEKLQIIQRMQGAANGNRKGES